MPLPEWRSAGVLRASRESSDGCCGQRSTHQLYVSRLPSRYAVLASNTRKRHTKVTALMGNSSFRNNIQKFSANTVPREPLQNHSPSVLTDAPSQFRLRDQAPQCLFVLHGGFGQERLRSEEHTS